MGEVVAPQQVAARRPRGAGRCPPRRGWRRPRKQLRSMYSLGFIDRFSRKALPNLRVLCPPTHFSSILPTRSGSHQAPFSAIDVAQAGVALEHAGPQQHPQRAGRPPPGLGGVDRHEAGPGVVVGRPGARVRVQHQAELFDDRPHRLVARVVVGRLGRSTGSGSSSPPQARARPRRRSRPRPRRCRAAMGTTATPHAAVGLLAQKSASHRLWARAPAMHQLGVAVARAAPGPSRTATRPAARCRARRRRGTAPRRPRPRRRASGCAGRSRRRRSGRRRRSWPPTSSRTLGAVAGLLAHRQLLGLVVVEGARGSAGSR